MQQSKDRFALKVSKMAEKEASGVFEYVKWVLDEEAANLFVKEGYETVTQITSLFTYK